MVRVIPILRIAKLNIPRQLSISHKLLSSNSSDESMTFKFPLELSRQLAEQASHFSQRSMEVHGIGLVLLRPSQ